MPGCAAVLYVWNVTDGMLAKGKKKFAIGSSRMQMHPLFDGQINGIAMRVNF